MAKTTRITGDILNRIIAIGTARDAADIEGVMKVGMEAILDLCYVQNALERRRSGERDRARSRRENAGVVGPALRWEILTRDEYRCTRCGRRAPDVELNVDHVHPVSRGGTTKPSNLTTLCRDCNLGKSDRA